MQVSEEQRRALYERLREHLDEATATLLLEVTVPANIELATRSDIRELRGELLLSLAEHGERIGARFAALEQRFSGVEERIARVEERIAGVEERIAKVEERIASLEERIAGIDERIAGVDERLVRVEASVLGLDVSMKHRLYKVVLPSIVSIQLVLFGLSEFALR